MDYKIKFEAACGKVDRLVPNVEKIITYEGFTWFKDLQGNPIFATKACEINEIEQVEGTDSWTEGECNDNRTI